MRVAAVDCCMVNPPTPPTKATTARFQSLDILRGLIILVMLFVNDLAGMKGLPPWMEHIQPSNADGMTFVDVVFPAFLFIVGVSIPFAIGGRLERGVPAKEIWLHILSRTGSLLIIGFFMVNGETISAKGPLSPTLWGLLIYIGVLFLWITLPVNANGRVTLIGLRVVGAIMLVAAALLYRGNDATGILQMRPQWWGILGLIGWAYLGACTVYMCCRRNLAGVIGAMALMYCVTIAESVGGLTAPSWLSWLTAWVSPGTVFGSQTAITVAGMALGMALAPNSSLTTPAARVRWAALFGLGLAAAGVLLHTAHHLAPVFFYNKNAATPPWCLVSSAITVWLWVAAYAVGDIRPMRWAASLAPAGKNALMAYLLAPLLYYAFDLLAAAGLPHFYNILGRSFAVGFWRSLVFAILVIWIAGALQRRGIHLKL